jgi:hypothetical protein
MTECNVSFEPWTINRNHLDFKSYELKFKEVDDWLSRPAPETDVERKIHLELERKFMLDETTDVYLNFRLDGRRIRYYPYQDLIAQDKHRFIYFRAANQIGKSIKLDTKAARNLITDHGKSHNEAIVSKSLPQSIFQMRRVKSLLKSMQTINWTEVPVSNESMSIISVDIKESQGRTKYTNMLICAPCTEGLLGYDLHELNLDEFEFWDVDLRYFYEQIAEPRTYHTKGNITIFSNPNGSENYGAELERVKLPDGTLKFHTYVFNFIDKPGNVEYDFELAAAGKTRRVVESTLLAIRSISSRNYFTTDEIKRSYDPTLSETNMVGKQPFFFLDVGYVNDSSVLVGGYIEQDSENENIKHLYIPIIHRYPVGYPISRVAGVNVDDSDGWHHETSVKEHIEEWSVDGIIPVFGYDATGNKGMKALFDVLGIEAEDVTMSGPQKSGMYQKFKYYMEKGLLHRIKHDQWEYEAGHLVIVKTKSGRLETENKMKKTAGYDKIHADSDKDHDDCCDATSGLVYLTDSWDYTEPSVMVI